MKKLILSLVAVAMLFAQPLIAGSAREGGEQQAETQVGVPASPAQPGEMPMDAEMEAAEVAASAEEFSAVIVGGGAVASTASASVIHQNKAQSPVKTKSLRPHRAGKAHGDSRVFGILSLVSGIIAFLLSWAVWPAGLGFAVLAIIFGIVGLSIDPSSVMSLVGLILGVLTILLPVLIMALVA